MSNELEAIAKIVNAKVVEKFYDQVLSEPLQETSSLVTHLIKTAKLVCAPLQIASAYQDRLEIRLRASVEKVQKENRINPPASILIPVINHLSYIEDGNFLSELYQNLLAKAIDKTRISEAHPAFIITISQLSPDEAVILNEVKSRDIHMDRFSKVQADKNPARLQLTDYVGTDFQLEKLIFPDNFDMYISHLRSLNLIASSGVKQDFIYDNDNPKKQIGTKNKLAIFPTDFGLLFLRACLTT